MADVQTELRETLATRTGTDAGDWFLVFRARHGMLVVLRELARLHGEGSIVTQLLTCCTAVDPIIAAGLHPLYGDVSAKTLSLDAGTLPTDPSVMGIVDQHTFGYIDVASSRALRKAADERGAVLLEDCAHCVGRLATDDDDMPYADFSFHSFGVEKMLPTYFGGAVWVNPRMKDTQLHDAVAAALSSLPEPAGKLAKAMRSYRTQIRALNHMPAKLAHGLRERMVAHGSFEPAIAQGEMAGEVAHEPMRMDAWSCEQVIGPLEALPTSLDLRVAALDTYARELADVHGVKVSRTLVGSGQPLLRLAVNLPTNKEADDAIAGIAAAGLYAVPWYRPLLYPGVSDPRIYGYDGSLGTLPNTAALTRGTVALPCDLSPARVHDVAKALRGAVVSR
ncbi:MAG: DegT/DnrJ/EryC1/StrS aminotransferase family protein [Atopobiaceae bacterium]|nr:DegT/DnrJ/EryC1/StrS aminotransferase family protein [Atopobiaceae bacterium]